MFGGRPPPTTTCASRPKHASRPGTIMRSRTLGAQGADPMGTRLASKVSSGAKQPKTTKSASRRRHATRRTTTIRRLGSACKSSALIDRVRSPPRVTALTGLPSTRLGQPAPWSTGLGQPGLGQPIGVVKGARCRRSSNGSVSTKAGVVSAVPAVVDMAWSRTTAVVTTSMARRNAAVVLAPVCNGEHRMDVTCFILVDRSAELSTADRRERFRNMLTTFCEKSKTHTYNPSRAGGVFQCEFWVPPPEYFFTSTITPLMIISVRPLFFGTPHLLKAPKRSHMECNFPSVSLCTHSKIS
jgi:hypothetical protein